MKTKLLFSLFAIACLAHANSLSPLLPIQQITATGTGPDVSIAGDILTCAAGLSTVNTAGTSPTLAVTLQSSPPLALGPVQATVGATNVNLYTAATTNNQLAASFTAAGTGSAAVSIKNATLMIQGTGALTGTYTVAIFADSSGPSGSALGTSATVAAAAITIGSYAPVTFTFANPVDLTGGSKYWIVLSQSAAFSASNFISWRSLTVASGGINATYNGTTWTLVSTQAFEFYSYQYTFTATGISFSGATTGTAFSQQMFPLNPYGSVFRAAWTLGGTSSPAYYAAIMADAKSNTSQGGN